MIIFLIKMPKTKTIPKVTAAKKSIGKDNIDKKPKEELKETLIDDEEKEIDPELIVGGLEEEETEDEVGGLDDDEVDPFKDKWEE